MNYLYRIEVYNSLVVRRFPVVKWTPCGAKIDIGEDKPRFVNLQARKQFANRTIPQAREAFLARNAKRIKHLENQLDEAKRAREMVKDWNGEVKEFSNDLLHIGELYPITLLGDFL